MMTVEDSSALAEMSTMIQAVIPKHEFRCGWIGEDFSAAVALTDKGHFLLYTGAPHPLEYARILADCGMRGLSPNTVSMSSALAQELKVENGFDLFFLVRNRPFPPHQVPSNVSVITDGSCDAEIEKFLHHASPDAAVKPGNPEIDFWIVLRDTQQQIVAVSAGVVWQSGERIVNSVAVAESARRHGYGALVTLMACQQHFARNAARVALGVRASNRGALALYRKLGFDEEFAMTILRLTETSGDAPHVH